MARSQRHLRVHTFRYLALSLVLGGWPVATSLAQANRADLPMLAVDRTAIPRADWLIKPDGFKAGVFRAAEPDEIVLTNGLISRTFRLAPNAATVEFVNLMTGESMLRAVRPEAVVTIDGSAFEVGGLHGQPNHAYLAPHWLADLEVSPDAFRFTDFEVGAPAERLAWKPVRHHAPDVLWPPPGVSLRLDFHAPSPNTHLAVAVHYELYDGIPLLAKWITVRNDGANAVQVDRFVCESLAVVEYASYVGGPGNCIPTPNLRVETDYSFGGGMAAVAANTHAVRWIADPEYATQVHYKRQTPCLLEVGPALGPAQELAPGASFESFHVFELAPDSTERERRGLAVRRMYRTLAPWVTENPLMMHARFADWDNVKNAIDQCAAVGFEMVILTFGSGFNIEDDSDEYRAQMTKYAEYARSKGIEIGGYSLLASRHVGGGNDVVMPEGEHPRFGNSPCLQSAWGQAYFKKLYRFYGETGFSLLEHDGSYPGDACIATDHPGHRGYEDSRWSQWREITDFYKWCCGHGVYLNVPDWYYLSGSNKCGMGYRETNWSLPRAQQVIHTRQNIYDGTWEKMPSMGLDVRAADRIPRRRGGGDDRATA